MKTSYSVQNHYGEVYGFFDLPASGMSTEVWVMELRAKLAKDLGINGIQEIITKGENRIAIDIHLQGDERERLDRIHATIAELAFEHSL